MFWSRLRLLPLLLLLPVMALAELSAADSIAMYLESGAINSGKIPQEMIYLHLDNTSYFRDDKIHFSSNLVTADHFRPSNLSTTVYVELLNPGGKVIDRAVLKAVNGRCHGSLSVSESPFYSGFYEIRAYTRYMLNFGADAVYSRVIPVFSSPKTDGDYSQRHMLIYGSGKLKYDRPKPSGAKDVNMTLFPEGGRLVAGLPARVAFEVTDKSRRPLEVTGRVLDAQTDSVVAEIAASHLGRGVFSFTPGATKYKAEIEVGGKRHTFPLPAVEPNGVALMADNLASADSLLIAVSRTPDFPDRVLGATLSCRGVLYGRFIIDLSDSNSMSFKVPTAKLPSGVVTLTLFNTSGTPVADRLFFNNRHDAVAVEAALSKDVYEPFEPVELSLKLKGGDSAPFSLSVTDFDNHVAYGSNILADMLLASEIKGYVHNPAYYFEEPDDSLRRKALDCLLMVQGWRKYSWKRLVGMELFSLDSLPEVGIEVHGRVVSRVKGTPRPGVTVSTMMSRRNPENPDSVSILYDAYTTDKDGRFAFRTDVEGNWMLMLAAEENGKKKGHRILLNRSAAPEVRSYDFSEMQVELDRRPSEVAGLAADSMAADIDYADFNSRSRMLNEVEVKADKSSKEWEIAQNRASSQVHYDVERETNALVDKGQRRMRRLDDLLPMLDRNFQFIGDTLKYRGRRIVYVVNHEQSNHDQLIDSVFPLTIPLEMIKDVYINTQPSVIYSQAASQMDYDKLEERMAIDRLFSCVVFIEMYPGMHVKMRNGARRITLEGYTRCEEFYSPDYSEVPPEPTDYRRTLYWNPEVRPDSDGNARVRFYNNATARRFTISAAGVAPSGALISKYRADRRQSRAIFNPSK